MGFLRLGVELEIRGRVILTAYPPGAIAELLARGFTLDEARQQVEALERRETSNLIVSSGKNLVAQMLGEQSGYDTGITYCAIGTDNTTPTVADTTLTVEAARKAITTYSVSANELTCSTYFLAAECTYAIEEIGVFGHSTASAAADSGVMMNHTLLSYDNSGGSVDLTIDVVITFG